MKTSNKILAGILLISFGFAITSHFVLHSKFLRRDFVSKDKVATFFYDIYPLNQPGFIKLYRLNACYIKPGKQARLSVEKSLIKNIKYIVINDTLIIHGDSSASQWTSPKVVLELATIPFADVKNCNVYIEGSRDSLIPPDFQLAMNYGHLYSRQPYGDTVVAKFFGRLKVNASNNSEIVLYKKDHFNNIDLNLDNSVFQERNAKHKNISITSDSSSTIVTGGRNFLLLNK
ncbi:hypothetical protein QTN47_20335 [Danxiaibacter flavus]|uniref:Auto-transporter adhesin head GIN domain-containing protein n=1 Tax=Danxiaibacter flavus TaxID=3049108 RepID=A0ABV3ZJ12_9BACT|nr:hypothetical protein QNM32_20340 [Chitinophagaceae bacterium DXS]